MPANVHHLIPLKSSKPKSLRLTDTDKHFSHLGSYPVHSRLYTAPRGNAAAHTPRCVFAHAILHSCPDHSAGLTLTSMANIMSSSGPESSAEVKIPWLSK